jgi:hypothetical protein
MPAYLLTGGLWVREVAFQVVSIGDAARAVWPVAPHNAPQRFHRYRGIVNITQPSQIGLL